MEADGEQAFRDHGERGQVRRGCEHIRRGRSRASLGSGHGIAKALLEFNSGLRGLLKKQGLITKGSPGQRKKEIRKEGRQGKLPVLETIESAGAWPKKGGVPLFLLSQVARKNSILIDQLVRRGKINAGPFRSKRRPLPASEDFAEGPDDEQRRLCVLLGHVIELHGHTAREGAVTLLSAAQIGHGSFDRLFHTGKPPEGTNGK